MPYIDTLFHFGFKDKNLNNNLILLLPKVDSNFQPISYIVHPFIVFLVKLPYTFFTHHEEKSLELEIMDIPKPETFKFQTF